MLQLISVVGALLILLPFAGSQLGITACTLALGAITKPAVMHWLSPLIASLGTPGDYVHPRQVLKLAGMNLIEKSSGMLRGRKRQSKRGRMRNPAARSSLPMR